MQLNRHALLDVIIWSYKLFSGKKAVRRIVNKLVRLNSLTVFDDEPASGLIDLTH